MSCTIVQSCEPFFQKTFKLGLGKNKTPEQTDCNNTVAYDDNQICKIKPISIGSQTAAKSIMSTERLLQILEKLREPLADYQQKRGLAKSAHYGFLVLICSMCQHSYSAVITIMAILYNLLPLLEGFVYLGRFVLDTTIDICKTKDTIDKISRTILFVAQLIIISFLTMLICGFILLPVWYLFSQIVGKVYGMLLTSQG